MFDDSTTPNPSSGPRPGEPLQPFSGGFPSTPPTPVYAPPLRTGVPPPHLPPSAPKKSSGKRGRRILFLVLLVLILLGGGAAVAALVFPGATSNVNATTNTNSVVANTNTVTNTNRSNVNVNTANTNSANTNLPASNLNTNTTANTNLTSNLNTNTAANTNTVTNTNTPPASYSQDTDGDKLNNYLEEWLGTSSANADSDGDGFPDGGEVTSKYSPLGNGTMTAADLQTFCAQNTVVTQYALPSADVSTLCGIASDLLTNIQVMASNSTFFDDLDVQLSTSCTSFGKLDSNVCSGLVSFVMVDYLVSGN